MTSLQHQFTPNTSLHRNEVHVMPTFTDRFLRKIGLLAATVQVQQGNDLPPPRYPPIDLGIPVCPPEILLERNQDIIDALRENISDQQLFDEHYFPAMLRLANMVQQLPASERHHHRNMGGLLRHSLEVGLRAVQLAGEQYTQDGVAPEQGTDLSWKLAVFIAGIGHDLGKIVTDILVTDRSTELKWSPYLSSLYDWATHNGVEHYFIHWKEGRGKKHITISSTLIDSVIKKDSLNWISVDGNDNVIWIHESLNNNPGTTNMIHQFIVAADQFSVRQDLKSIGRRELDADKSPVVLQHTGSTSESASKKSVVPQSIHSASLADGLGVERGSDVPQHHSRAPDNWPPKRPRRTSHAWWKRNV